MSLWVTCKYLKAGSHDKQKVSTPRPLRSIACLAYRFSPIEFLTFQKILCIEKFFVSSLDSPISQKVQNVFIHNFF